MHFDIPISCAAATRRRVAASLTLRLLACARRLCSASARPPQRPTSTKAGRLAGVTLTFGDQLKEYQTIFAATNALKGAAVHGELERTSSAGRRSSRPRPAARSTSATWPRRRPSSPRRPATRSRSWRPPQGANPKISPYDIVVPADSPIKTAAQLRGQTVAVQEGTVEQYFLVQVPRQEGHDSLQRGHDRQPDRHHRVDRGDQRPGRRRRHLASRSPALDLADGKVRVLATRRRATSRRSAT